MSSPPRPKLLIYLRLKKVEKFKSQRLYWGWEKGQRRMPRMQALISITKECKQKGHGQHKHFDSKLNSGIRALHNFISPLLASLKARDEGSKKQFMIILGYNLHPI